MKTIFQQKKIHQDPLNAASIQLFSNIPRTESVYENRKEQHIHTEYWLRFDFIRFWNSLIQIYQIDAKKKCKEMLNDTSSHE